VITSPSILGSLVDLANNGVYTITGIGAPVNELLELTLLDLVLTTLTQQLEISTFKLLQHLLQSGTWLTVHKQFSNYKV